MAMMMVTMLTLMMILTMTPMTILTTYLGVEQCYGAVLWNSIMEQYYEQYYDDISRSGAVVLVTGKQEAGINLGEILERSILFS